MNMQNLMAQAQKIQKDIQKKQSEIDAMIFEGKSEWITLSLNGKKIIQAVNIKKDVLKDDEDYEMLEDMIKIALNDAMKKIDAETESKLGMYGNSLNGLM